MLDGWKSTPRCERLGAAEAAWRWSTPTQPHSNVNGETSRSRPRVWAEVKDILGSRQSDSGRDGGGNNRVAQSSGSRRRRGRRREQLVRAELLSPSSELRSPSVLYGTYRHENRLCIHTAYVWKREGQDRGQGAVCGWYSGLTVIVFVRVQNQKFMAEVKQSLLKFDRYCFGAHATTTTVCACTFACTRISVSVKKLGCFQTSFETGDILSGLFSSSWDLGKKAALEFCPLELFRLIISEEKPWCETVCGSNSPWRSKAIFYVLLIPDTHYSVRHLSVF